MSKITFNNKNSIFYNSVKNAVDQYFKDKKIATFGNRALYFKALTLIPAAIILYSVVVFIPLHPLLALFFCGLLGFTIASVGFNVMHDACHGSYSKRNWVNYTMGLSLNCLGGNAYLWKMKHNIIHHTYPNVDGVDDDIAKMPVIRQCHSQNYKRIYRYQHIYSILVYSLSSFLWVFMMDFVKYFGKKIYTTPINRISGKEHFIFWMSKVLYLFFYILVPVYFVGVVPWICGFFTMHLVMGFTLAMVFQLAHVVEDTHFVDANNRDMKIEQEWAIHQVKTTANFATHNKIISWFVGGLNFQIEHHLFPKISHVHYPVISLIVKEQCRIFDVPYVSYPTMSAAIVSHFRFMKTLGKGN